MGLLRNGEWSSEWYDTDSSGGEFVRDKARFRNWVTVDGRAGPSGDAGFKAESGRYHLYVSYACPWCHRALIFMKLKGLDPHVSVSRVAPEMLDNGWEFSGQDFTDDLHGLDYMYQIYQRAKPDYSGRVTVPVLWDRETDSMVSNESSDIIRMFNRAFDDLTGNRDDYYPEPLRQAIDRVNGEVYQYINNGVYRAGFATAQPAYERAVRALFEHLEILEHQLGRQRYVVGNQLTEADWRLWATLIRFDAVYFGHFKCNLIPIADHPNLFNYLLELYQVPGIAETVRMDEIKRHYYYSHETINPTRVVPMGPVQSFSQPHDRDRF